MSKTPITDANEFEVYSPDYKHHGERVVRASVARKLEEQRNELLAALECVTDWGAPTLYSATDEEQNKFIADMAAARAVVDAAKEGV